jgi:hypothetical protein
MPFACSNSTLPFLDLQNNPSVRDQFFAPLMHVFDNYMRERLDCPEIRDEEFLHLGCARVLSQAASGRDFLQQQQEILDSDIKRSSFFATLHSARRERMLQEASLQLYLRGCGSFQDPGEDLLGAFAQLRGRALWAVDGHQIEHACHALKDKKGRYVGAKNLYLLCLHSGLMHNLSPVQGDGSYRHEMPVLREQLPQWLQHHQAKPKSLPPILVLDPAFVDKQFWTRMKLLTQAKAVMITRTKENMKPEKYSTLPWDPHADINRGVTGQYLVGFDGAVLMRLIQYTDPETGEEYEFLTTVGEEVPPGLIAWLYLMRWRIEKVFDTTKNKLQETKAWATGPVAQNIQGHFVALTHNLLVLFRHYLKRQHGLEEQKIIHKRANRLKERQRQAKANSRTVHPLHRKMPPVIQMSLQFIRTLRNHFFRPVSMTASLPRVQTSLSTYL